MHNRYNRETVIIPQTIMLPTKSIIFASLVTEATAVQQNDSDRTKKNR